MHARIALVAIFGLTGVLAGCGDDGPGTVAPTTEPTTVPTSSAPPSADELTSLLLTAGDLGPGWELGQPVNEFDFADSVQIPCDAMAINPVIAQRLTPTAGIQFAPTDDSMQFVAEFAGAGQADRLEADLYFFAEGMDACAASTAAGDQAGLSVERLSLPAVGDQSMAFTTIGGEPSGPTWHVRSARVRVGAIAITLNVTEIGADDPTQPTMSDAEFVELLETAVAKVDLDRSAE